ncbi:hypothetical protein [Singulisphaera sp. GP187]|uniref:hypothetical protein n=1 Tax=Singulisphaera sp. GP187 TaxID=1882752 RepID=UPI00116135DD|nr:hypothetical protein [Singulisphaera sp. GP187]
MNDAKQVCSMCGGTKQQGIIRFSGSPLLEHVRMEFVIPGEQTAKNPLTAFRQGISNAQSNLVFDSSKMVPYRCSKCGHFDIYAIE